MFKFIDFKKITAISIFAALMAGTLISSPAISTSDHNNGHGNNCDGVDSSNPGNGSPHGNNSNHNETDSNFDDEGRGECSQQATGTLSPSAISKKGVVAQTISLDRTITVNIDDIVQTITTTTPVEKLDILFLADNTGSMGSAIENVQDNAEDLLDEISENYDDVAFGVAKYYGDPQEEITEYRATGETETRSFRYRRRGRWYTYRYEVPVYERVVVGEVGATGAYQLQDAVGSGTVDDALDAIDEWSASGGDDWPEANFFALHQAATSGASTNSGYTSEFNTNWRDGAKKIIVWFGDAKSHTDTVSQAEAIQALNDNDITVIAIQTNTTSYSLTNGIDSDSQASSIALGTSGEYASVYSSELASTMEDLIDLAATETTTTTITPSIDLVFGNEGDTEGLDINYVCTDPLGCNGVQNGDVRTFQMNVTSNTGGNFQFQTVAENVSGAVADNDLNFNHVD